MEHKKPLSELSRGALVFAALAVFTAVEYFIAIYEAPVIFLWVIAILKGALVLIYFMHISRLSGTEGGHK
jgi:heme/copper-type cytochrome/quinol oxidase subunit 4